MASAVAEFSLNTTVQTRAKFELAGGRLLDSVGAMRPTYEAVGDEYLRFIRTRFQRASKGTGIWAPLAPSTIANRIAGSRGLKGRVTRLVRESQRANSGISGAAARTQAVSSVKVPILYDTGKLFDSLTRGGPGNVFAIRQNGISVGTRVKYGKYHQTGTKKMPARKFLVPPNAATKRKMIAIIQAAVRKFFHPTPITSGAA
jgi:phage gpG-like protein